MFWSEDEKEVNDSSNIHAYNSNTVRRNLRPSSVIKRIITSYVVAGCSSNIRYDEKHSLTPGVEEINERERGCARTDKIWRDGGEISFQQQMQRFLGVGGGGQDTSNHDKHTTSPNILFPHTLDHRAVWCHCESTDGAVALRPPTRCLSNYYSNPAN